MLLEPVVLAASELVPNAKLELPVVLEINALCPTAVFSIPVVFAFNAETPIAMFFSLEVLLLVFPLPTVIVFTTISLLNVLAPAKVCVPVVTTPPFVASAAARIKLFALTAAPAAYEVVVIVPTPVIPAEAVAHVAFPLASLVKTLPAVPAPPRYS